MNVSVVMACRDGEITLPGTIDSLLNQTIPVKVFVADDHSVDSTPDILNEFSKTGKVFTVRYANREPKDYTRVPVLLNMAIKIAEPADYYMISGDDNIYPPDYLERVISYMIKDNVGSELASGYNDGSNYSDIFSPTGSGRIISTRLWHSVTPFLENIGWESRTIFKTWQLGYDVGVYPVIKKHTRERKRKIFAWGRGSYINGYPFLWTLGRSTLAFLRGQHSFTNCCSIIFGHLEAVIKQPEKNDTADFVYNHMMKRTKSYLLWKLFRIKKKTTFEVKKIQV
jgi:glycosyltransferase involved in cell wall biosynthesis